MGNRSALHSVFSRGSSDVHRTQKQYTQTELGYAKWMDR